MNIEQAIETHLGIDWRTTYPVDQDVVDAMNTPSISVVGSVTINDLLGWAGNIDAFAKLEAVAALADDAVLADGSPDPRLAVRGAAGAALRLFGTLNALDLTRTDVQQMMDGLVAAGVFTTAEKDQLWALGTKIYAPYEYYKVPKVQLGNVAALR